MEVDGVAHMQLTVTDFAVARVFYGELLPFLGFTAVEVDFVRGKGLPAAPGTG